MQSTHAGMLSSSKTITQQTNKKRSWGLPHARYLATGSVLTYKQNVYKWP